MNEHQSRRPAGSGQCPASTGRGRGAAARSTGRSATTGPSWVPTSRSAATSTCNDRRRAAPRPAGRTPSPSSSSSSSTSSRTTTTSISSMPPVAPPTSPWCREADVAATAGADAPAGGAGLRSHHPLGRSAATAAQEPAGEAAQRAACAAGGGRRAPCPGRAPGRRPRPPVGQAADGAPALRAAGEPLGLAQERTHLVTSSASTAVGAAPPEVAPQPGPPRLQAPRPSASGRPVPFVPVVRAAQRCPWTISGWRGSSAQGTTSLVVNSHSYRASRSSASVDSLAAAPARFSSSPGSLVRSYSSGPS